MWYFNFSMRTKTEMALIQNPKLKINHPFIFLDRFVDPGGKGNTTFLVWRKTISAVGSAYLEPISSKWFEAFDERVMNGSLKSGQMIQICKNMMNEFHEDSLVLDYKKTLAETGKESDICLMMGPVFESLPETRRDRRRRGSGNHHPKGFRMGFSGDEEESP